MHSLDYDAARHLAKSSFEVDQRWADLILLRLSDLLAARKIDFSMLVAVFVDYCQTIVKSGMTVNFFGDEVMLLVKKQVENSHLPLVMGTVKNLLDREGQGGQVHIYVAQQILMAVFFVYGLGLGPVWEAHNRTMNRFYTVLTTDSLREIHHDICEALDLLPKELVLP